MSKPDQLDSRQSPAIDSRLDSEIYRQAIAAAPFPMIVVRWDGTVVLVNSAAVELFGYEASDLVGHSVDLLVPEGLRPSHRRNREDFNTKPATRAMGIRRDLMAVAKDGSEIPVEIGLSPVETSGGMMVICAIVDLTLRKRNEEELAELASRLGQKNEKLLELVATDSLTSLKSRRAFLDHLSVQVEVAVRHARTLSVLILDIDHFKQYNDDFGHLAGDEILREFGRALRRVARRSDFAARLGGEEFGIVLPETGVVGAKALGERFRSAIEEVEWPSRQVTASVGVTTVAFDQPVPRPVLPDLSRILGEADRALYRSKEIGRNRVTHFGEMEGGE